MTRTGNQSGHKSAEPAPERTFSRPGLLKAGPLKDECQRGDKARQHGRCRIEHRAADQLAFDLAVDHGFARWPAAENAGEPAVWLQLATKCLGDDLGCAIDE